MGTDAMRNPEWIAGPQPKKWLLALPHLGFPRFRGLWYRFRKRTRDAVSNAGRYHSANRRIVGGVQSHPRKGSIR